MMLFVTLLTLLIANCLSPASSYPTAPDASEVESPLEKRYSPPNFSFQSLSGGLPYSVSGDWTGDFMLKVLGPDCDLVATRNNILSDMDKGWTYGNVRVRIKVRTGAMALDVYKALWAITEGYREVARNTHNPPDQANAGQPWYREPRYRISVWSNRDRTRHPENITIWITRLGQGEEPIPDTRDMVGQLTVAYQCFAAQMFGHSR